MGDSLELAKSYIKENEGLRLRKYKDSLGKWTIGFGHLILPGENYSVITQKQADELFEKDFTKHFNEAKKFPNFENLTGTQQIVVVDLCFNMGGNFYLNFPKFTKHLSEGDAVNAAKELKDSKYYKQTGRRAKNNIKLLLT
jgi:lysozyme